MAYVESITAKNETRTIRDLNGQQMLATVQASTTASKAYAVGDYLILNDKLYKVTTAIASGGTITVGTNVEEAKVGTELTELNRQLSDSTTGLNSKAPVIVNTASGDIASFADGADGMPIKSLVANIEPVQDLHGYDNPWPAGGGKNKISVQPVLETTNIQTLCDFGADVTGTYSLSFVLTNVTFQAGNAALFAFVNNSGVKMYLTAASVKRISDGVALTSITQPVSGSFRADASNTTEITFRKLECFFMSDSYGKYTGSMSNVQLEAGSSVTDFTPYSNICPISGRTGCSVVRSGKNLLNSATNVINKGINASGTIVNATGSRGGNYTQAIKVNTGESYVFSATSNDSGQWTRRVHGYDNNGNWVSQLGVIGESSAIPDGTRFQLTIVIPENVTEIRASYMKKDTDAQIELGSSASEYESFNATTVNVSWLSEAGTVYGGTLDVISGMLTVTYFLYNFDGTESFNKSVRALNAFWTNMHNTPPHNWPAMKLNPNYLKSYSSMFISTNDANRYTNNYGYLFLDSGVNFSCDPSIFGTTTESFKAKLTELYNNGTPVSVCAEIATPLIYQLTPQQLDTLLGQNNVWADTGDTTVEYPADTKLYIDGKIAEAIANALNA